MIEICSKQRLNIFLLCLMTWIQSIVAFASLGNTEASLEEDRRALAGTFDGPENRRICAVHTIVSKRLTLREYSTRGVIFGISWTGVHHPDLSGLLGIHFEDYRQGLGQTARSKRTRSHGTVVGQKVVVEKWGHMRWVQGRAYVPELMPSGMSSDDIR